MSRRFLTRAMAILIVLSMMGFGGWILALPAATEKAMAPPVPQQESDAMLASLKPKGQDRPLVAVIGINDATETTDYLVPTGILRRAGIADVMLLAIDEGHVRLYPALTVEPDATTAEFDAAHPDGADYVIVPAMSRDDDPYVLAWLRQQSKKGATIVGICAGAKVVAAAGLLDGKRATTHWYYLGEMLKRNPAIRYVADRRMVADEGLATTTGISASIPMMLIMIEAIADRAKAEAVARELGIEQWSARHASRAFRLTRPFAMTVLANRLAFWTREVLGIRLQPRMDEVSVALVADAWSRTYRSHATSYAGSPGAVTTMNGIRILPDTVDADWPEIRQLSTFSERKPAEALDLTLDAIARRFGEDTGNVVAMQLEYPRETVGR